MYETPLGGSNPRDFFFTSGVAGAFIKEPISTKTETKLDAQIKNAEKPFNEYMRFLMNKKNLTSTDIYRHGNIDRKYFSKLISNKVTPSKQKLLVLAVARTEGLTYFGE